MLRAAATAVPHCMSFADLTSNLEKDVEHVYGESDPTRDVVRAARRVIVKVMILHILQIML